MTLMQITMLDRATIALSPQSKPKVEDQLVAAALTVMGDDG